MESTLYMAKTSKESFFIGKKALMKFTAMVQKALSVSHLVVLRESSDQTFQLFKIKFHTDSTFPMVKLMAVPVFVSTIAILSYNFIFTLLVVHH